MRRNLCYFLTKTVLGHYIIAILQNGLEQRGVSEPAKRLITDYQRIAGTDVMIQGARFTGTGAFLSFSHQRMVFCQTK